MFFFRQNSSVLFSITRSSSFSVIHVSINIKNNVEKNTTLPLCFLSKSPAGHAISFQIKPELHFGCHTCRLNYFILVCLWCGRTLGRAVHGHVITKFSRTGSLPHFLTHGAPLLAFRARKLRYKISVSLQ